MVATSPPTNVDGDYATFISRIPSGQHDRERPHLGCVSDNLRNGRGGETAVQLAGNPRQRAS